MHHVRRYITPRCLPKVSGEVPELFLRIWTAGVPGVRDGRYAREGELYNFRTVRHGESRQMSFETVYELAQGEIVREWLRRLSEHVEEMSDVFDGAGDSRLPGRPQGLLVDDALRSHRTEWCVRRGAGRFLRRET